MKKTTFTAEVNPKIRKWVSGHLLGVTLTQYSHNVSVWLDFKSNSVDLLRQLFKNASSAHQLNCSVRQYHSEMFVDVCVPMYRCLLMLQMCLNITFHLTIIVYLRLPSTTLGSNIGIPLATNVGTQHCLNIVIQSPMYGYDIATTFRQ